MDPLNSMERQKAILQMVNSAGRVSVRELADTFGVSEVTIRSDLGFLDEKRLLIRSRGGAIINSVVGRELSIKEKHEKHHDLKRKLGEAVAALIKNDERIVIDSGTTTEEVAIAMRAHQNVIVMTNGLNVANELAQAEGVEVLLTGGVLRKKSMSFFGSQAESTLRNYHFDKVVLGVDGFDLKVGLTTHFEAEANINRLMCAISDQVIVVTDSTKFMKRGFHIICASKEIDVLVTDTLIPQEYLDEISRQGTRVHLVDPGT